MEKNESEVASASWFVHKIMKQNTDQIYIMTVSLFVHLFILNQLASEVIL